MIDVGRDFRLLKTGLKEGLRLIVQFFEFLPKLIKLIKDLIEVVEKAIVENIKALVKDPKKYFRIFVDDVMKWGRFVFIASAGKI